MTDAELLVDFLNTLDVEEAVDLLDEDPAWLAWLREHELPARDQPQPNRAEARVLRDQLRAVAQGEQRATTEFPLTLVLADGEARLGGEGALEQVLGAVARLAVRGELPRVKICPADDCRWAFYDTSRNSSRQWCSMAVCGNRAKARAHRARQSPGATSS